MGCTLCDNCPDNSMTESVAEFGFGYRAAQDKIESLNVAMETEVTEGYLILQLYN